MTRGSILGPVQRWLPPLLLALAPVGTRAQPSEFCAPSPEVRSAIGGLPVRSILETAWEYRQKRLQAIQSLLGRYPDDMFVQRAYVSAAEWSQANQEYQARHEQKPDDPRIAFLYGLTLVGHRSGEAIKVLEGALAGAPDYPWPHRPLARIYNSPVFRDKERAAAHVKAFLDACPAEVVAYQQLATLDDKSFVAAGAERLRALIEKRSDAEAIGGYQELWSLEFQVRGAAGYAAVRKQVSKDLDRIRALQLEDQPEWYGTLQNGYKLVNDPKQADWAADEQERRFPQPSRLNARSKWFEDHPYPKRFDPPGKKREFYAEAVKQAGAWLKERPNAVYFWGARLDAMSQLDDTPAAALETAADEYLRVAEKDAGPRGPAAYVYFNAAEALSKRHLAPQRVVEMATKGLAQWEAADPPSDLDLTKDNLADHNFYHALDWLNGAVLKTRGYLDGKQPDNARSELARIAERQESLRKLAGTKEEYKSEYSSQMAEYWELMARTAEMRNHPVDAMTFYTNALMARFDAREIPETGVKDEVADNAHELWTKLGGTQEGWNTWYGRRAEALTKEVPVSWEQANEPLPAFELTDITGKAWTLASLKGKVNFLNFWASW